MNVTCSPFNHDHHREEDRRGVAHLEEIEHEEKKERSDKTGYPVGIIKLVVQKMSNYEGAVNRRKRIFERR